MTYVLSDVQRLEKDIRALVPDAEFAHWDYDYSLAVKLGDRIVTACQPERRGEPKSYVFQKHIWRTPNEVVRLLKGETE